MSDEKKIPRTRVKGEGVFRSSLYVWITLAIVAGMMPIQLLYGRLDFTVILSGLGLVLTAYIGIDNWAAIKKTQSLPVGKKFKGNRTKLESILIGTLMLVLEAVVLNIFMEPGLAGEQIPMTDLFFMSCVVVGTFVGTTKGNTVAEETHRG